VDKLLAKWDNAYRNLEIANAVFVASKQTKRPRHKLGCCGCSGDEHCQQCCTYMCTIDVLHSKKIAPTEKHLLHQKIAVQCYGFCARSGAHVLIGAFDR
jgi:hypothetical protein